MGDTNRLPELLTYLLLDRPAPGLWCLAPSGFKEVQDRFARFGGMSVSSIHRCGIALPAIRLPPAVGGGATGLDPCALRGFPPGLSSLRQFHHLLFGVSSLLVIYAWSPFSSVTIWFEMVVSYTFMHLYMNSICVSLAFSQRMQRQFAFARCCTSAIISF